MAWGRGMQGETWRGTAGRMGLSWKQDLLRWGWLRPVIHLLKTSGLNNASAGVL